MYDETHMNNKNLQEQHLQYVILKCIKWASQEKKFIIETQDFPKK